MVLFISSWSHHQVSKVSKWLVGTPRSSLDLHDVCHGQRGFALCQHGDRLRIFDGRKYREPTVIYWNSRPRADAAMAPRDTRYVAAYRSRLKQLAEDISFAFPDEVQLPGPLTAIERCESKPWLMRKAFRLGLKVPSYTWDAVGNTCLMKCLREYGQTYRKVIGPPHVVTESGLGITTTNSLVRRAYNKMPARSNPWQLQEPINFVAQWRFQVVGSSVWASRWIHAPHGREWDLRFHQEILGERLNFTPAQPDNSVIKSLVRLVSTCGLSHAAPEMLEMPDGRMVFIDLNPCGDWVGFFGRRQEKQIAQELAGAVRARAGL